MSQSSKHFTWTLVGALSVLILSACAGGADESGVPDAPVEEVADEEAEAPDVADEGSYAGNLLEMIVPFGPGGGTDTTARFIAQRLEPHLPEGASVQVVNITGAGGLIGMNEFALTDPDVPKVVWGSASTHAASVIGEEGVRWDLGNFHGLFGTPGPTLLYGLPDTDLTTDALTYGGSSITGTDLRWALAFELLENDGIEMLLGYDGGGDVAIAYEQGEIQLGSGSAPAYENLSHLEDEGRVALLAQSGQIEDGDLVRDPNHADVPTVKDLYEELHGTPPSGPAWDSYLAIVAATNTNQSVMWMKADAPDWARAELEAAVEAMASESDFQEELDEVKGGDTPFNIGTQLQGALTPLVSPNPDSLTFLKVWLEEEHGVSGLS